MEFLGYRYFHIQLNKVVTYIEGYTKPVISEAEVRRIYETLSSANVKDPDARKEHVSNVRSNIVRRNQSVSNGICPLCGGKLVQRYGKYGNFYGCSNIPTANTQQCNLLTLIINSAVFIRADVIV